MHLTACHCCEIDPLQVWTVGPVIEFETAMVYISLSLRSLSLLTDSFFCVNADQSEKLSVMSSDRGFAEDRRDHLPIRTVRIPQNASMDLGDSDPKQKSQYHPAEGYGGRHAPPASFQPPGRHQSYQQPHPPSTRHAPQRLHSVVTGSFSSFDAEERDDFSGRARGSRYPSSHSANRDFPRQAPSFSSEARYPEEDQVRQGTDERERHVDGFRAPAPPEAGVEGYAMANPVKIPPSPSAKPADVEMRDAPEMQAPTFRAPSDNLKRSFWHHSSPEDQKADPLHPAFMPPKRTKIGKGPPGDKVIIRTPSTVDSEAEERSREAWYSRNYSWSQDMYNDGKAAFHQKVRKSRSFPSPTPWNGGPSDPSQAYRGPPGGEPMPVEYPNQWSSQERRSSPSAFRGVPPRRSPHGQLQPHHSVHRADSFTPSEGGHWRGSHGNGSWTSASPRNQSPRAPPGISPSWSGSLAPPPPRLYREDHSPRPHYRDSQPPIGRNESDMRRQVTFESGGREMEAYHHGGYSFDRADMHGDMRPPPYPTPTSKSHSPRMPPQRSPYESEHRRQVFFNDQQAMETVPEVYEAPKRDGSIKLLALPEDRVSLSETLCTIRENVEVFTATPSDVEAPAPGRKHPVVVGQVGLRCIHCSHVTRASEKVKRAVCYPSSIMRIYRTVIDMKLDHFQHCRFVPHALKQRLEELKATNTRSTGTTMQYFVKAARKLGMVDGNSGVRLIPVDANGSEPADLTYEQQKEEAPLQQAAPPSSPDVAEEREPATPGSEIEYSGSNSSESRDQSFSDESFMHLDTAAEGDNIPHFTGIVGLTLPEDKSSLSPLRCFLRENVCAFSATEEDIAVRTPTTFSVVQGQVGIGCIHCHKLPAKERSNRAVCFPFSIGRIYQSVADIQRFHINECKMIPQAVRDKFNELQSASSKGSKGLATRQYWVSSAKKIGLVDTPNGIRFGRDPSEIVAPAVSLDILAQVASNVTTVDRPLVLEEDKDCIAEFLYVVMEQLQPCRFTEADRNKRRLKNVGCIGVECKHCAGQVESRKFFWSSVSAVESNFVSVHTHMMDCKMVPEPLKERLAELKAKRKEQTAALKIGSQKAFFARVWNRLHADDTRSPAEASRKTAEPETTPTQASSVDKVRDKMAVVSV